MGAKVKSTFLKNIIWREIQYHLQEMFLNLGPDERMAVSETNHFDFEGNAQLLRLLSWVLKLDYTMPMKEKDAIYMKRLLVTKMVSRAAELEGESLLGWMVWISDVFLES